MLIGDKDAYIFYPKAAETRTTSGVVAATIVINLLSMSNSKF